MALPSGPRAARASALKRGVAQVLAQPAGDLDLDLLGLLLRVGRAQDGLEQVGVEDQRVEVVADRVDVDVLVDELDGLRRRARARAACPVPVDGLTDS